MSFLEELHKPDILDCISHLSSDEVFTPPKLVNEILDTLPQELFKSPDTKFLDPCCKSGVFLREIAKRLIDGLAETIPDLEKRTEHIFKNQLFGLAITELTGLLSRRSVYCSKNANCEYSICSFDNHQGNIEYKRTYHISPIAHVLNKNGMDEYLSLSSGKTFFSNPTTKDITASISPNHVAMLIESKRYKVFDKDGNCIADFLNNKKLNSAPIRYLNEKLLMYFAETEVSDGMYKIGLVDYSGKVLTDIKYSHIQAITGTTCVLGTNLVGGLNELIDENGKVLLSKMKNAISWEGEDNEGRLISPISYWKEDDDPTDIDKCLQVDESIISSTKVKRNSEDSE